MRLRNLSALFMAAALAGQAPQLRKAEARPVNDSLPGDPALLRVIEPAQKEIESGFGKVIGQAPDGLFKGRFGEENLLGYWIADAMRERASALGGGPVKFAFTNGGGVRTSLKPGPVRVGDIFEVMPFENEMIVVELTGAEVIGVIRESLQRRGGEPCSGVRVELSGPVQKPILKVTWADGSLILPGETVRVVTSDYLYGGGDGIPSLRKGRKPNTTGLTIRQALLDAVQELTRAGRTLGAPPAGRYKITPELFQAMRDRKLGPIEGE
ncbi:MAG: 5'-nucleotidase C-terminal domain-containing protein [Acidobacteria bacterium]|nr:5'-nucleotidase C-terminal domain-containing protein [Acidobacteriota bacterium]